MKTGVDFRGNRPEKYLCSICNGFFHVLASISKESNMRIAVVGTGYVGLVTGSCFADLGNQVICVDVDRKKSRACKKGLVSNL